jgi:hypothetical protein
MAMVHVAIQEQIDWKTVDWMKKVSDEQYRQPKSIIKTSLNNDYEE